MLLANIFVDIILSSVKLTAAALVWLHQLPIGAEQIRPPSETAKAYMFYFNNVMYFQVKRVLKKNKTGQGILYI